MDLNQELITTVVGSYPARPSSDSLGRSYFKDLDPFMESIEEAVNAQLDAGIELVSDGQTRGGMVEIFANRLKGYRMKKRPEIVSDIEYRKPIIIKDLTKVKNGLPEDKGLKGIITGPWTMVKSSYDLHYKNTEEAVIDTAEALKVEVQKIADICDMIQIDEPFLSIEFCDYVVDAIEMLIPKGTTSALHVCGDVTDIAEELIEIDVDILDHEFAGNPKLFDVFHDLSFSQRLAPGVITTENRIDEVSEIKDRIERAIDRFGMEILIDPDCGLKNIGKDVAYKKIKNMVQARDVVLDERG